MPLTLPQIKLPDGFHIDMSSMVPIQPLPSAVVDIITFLPSFVGWGDNVRIISQEVRKCRVHSNASHPVWLYNLTVSVFDEETESVVPLHVDALWRAHEDVQFIYIKKEMQAWTEPIASNFDTLYERPR